MTKLSDVQLVILSKACQHPDRHVLPLPRSLKGGAALKVVASLVSKGLIEERKAKRGETVWQQEEDGLGTTLVATDKAFEILGIQDGEQSAFSEVASAAARVPRAARASRAPTGGRKAGSAAGSATGKAKPRSAPRRREGTKQEQLIAMLKRKQGATVEEIASALDWQHHTVRGAFAGALKKKLGLAVTSEKVEGRGRVYRL